MASDAGELDVEWLDEAGAGVAAVRRSLARLTYRPRAGGPPVVVAESGRQRFFEVDELAALARRAGLAVLAVHGAFDERVAVDDEAAWRLLVVLGRS
jgi:hypothetical protein